MMMSLLHQYHIGGQNQSITMEETVSVLLMISDRVYAPLIVTQFETRAPLKLWFVFSLGWRRELQELGKLTERFRMHVVSKRIMMTPKEKKNK
jgi:hypothetical protein